MKSMATKEKTALKEEPLRRDEDLCSECLLCVNVCPFDAISVDEEGAPDIDIEECQFCGICAGICPSGALDIDYYDHDALVDYVEQQMQNQDTSNLVVACRGSDPVTKEMKDILADYKVDMEDFVNIRLPCVGRLDPEFYIKALAAGVEKVLVIKCDEDFCRFEDGSAINTRWFTMMSELLDQFEFEDNTLTILRNPMKAVYETADCVGCQKCEYICPYDAVEAQDLATPNIDFDACEGCGACFILCSEFAIQVEGYEHDTLRSKVQEYKEAVEEKGEEDTVLVFCCQWAEYLNLDVAEDGFIRDNVAVIEIPCFTGLDPSLVIDALKSFDGVMVAYCPDDDCKREEGRDVADRNALALVKTLENLEMDDRLEMFETSPRMIGKFDSKLDEFISDLSSD